MRIRALSAVALLALLPAVAGAWGSPPPPAGTVLVDTGYGPIELWPYTGTDYSGTPSDPVNLFFPDADPRAIRQALMALPPAPPLGCTWIDAMGYEQTAWAQSEGWVGSEIQLACTDPAEPLGNPLRLHLRLFRQGPHTVGAAHFEILLQDTAQHQVLSWDFAEMLVLGDIDRTGALTAVQDIWLPSESSFRVIPQTIYNLLLGAGLGPLFNQLGYPTDPVGADFPIPTLMPAKAITADLVYDPVPERIRTEYAVTYNVNAPKPFCSRGEDDFVNLTGDLQFVLTAYTDWSGRYYRSYKVDGELIVTSLVYDPGTSAPAVVKERHAAVLADHYGQVYEINSQRLLSDPPQTLFWKLTAGEFDFYLPYLQCGP